MQHRWADLLQTVSSQAQMPERPPDDDDYDEDDNDYDYDDDDANSVITSINAKAST